MYVPVLNRTISRYRTEYTMIIIMIVNACVIMKTRHGTNTVTLFTAKKKIHFVYKIYKQMLAVVFIPGYALSLYIHRERK